MLTARLSTPSNGEHLLTDRSEEEPLVAQGDENQDLQESESEVPSPPTNAGQKLRRRFSSEKNAALVEGFILREITRQEAEKALDNYVRATVDTPAKSEAGEEYVSAQRRTWSMAEAYEKSVSHAFREVVPTGFTIARGSRDPYSADGDMTLTNREGRVVVVELQWMLQSANQSEAIKKVRSFIGRFRLKNPETALLVVCPVRLRESFVAALRKERAEVVTWKSGDDTEVLRTAIKRLAFSTEGSRDGAENCPD